MWTRLPRTLSLLAVLLLPLPLSAESGPQLSLTTSPNGGYIQAGSAISTSIHIPFHPDNRVLSHGLACTNYDSSSLMDLNDKSPTRISQVYSRLPAGICRAWAVLHYEEKGKLKQKRVQGNVVEVIGFSASPRF